MSRLTRLYVILILAIGLVAGGITYIHDSATSPVDVNRLVTNALTRQNAVDYIAQVRTSTIYLGKPIATDAVVTHCGLREKIENPSRSGRGAWAMTDGARRYTFLPNNRTLLASETGGMFSDSDRVKLILANYEAKYDGVGNVAGRKTYIVELTPRRAGRPSKKLWIDRQYYTILRSVDYSASGHKRATMETTKIAYKVKINASVFNLPKDSATKVVNTCVLSSASLLRKTLGFLPSAPSYIPGGFELEGYYLYNCRCNCKHTSAQLTYTDGLNVISVFETSSSVACGTGSCDMGAKGRHGNCAMEGCEMAKAGRVVRGDKVVLVVGDLASDEIRRMAESVR